MGKKGLFFALLVFLLIPLTASALITESPSSIVFSSPEEVQIISFTIQNHYSETKPLEAGFFSPFRVRQFGNLPKTLAPNQLLQIKYQIFSDADLADTVYNSTFRVSLGGVVEKRVIQMSFSDIPLNDSTTKFTFFTPFLFLSDFSLLDVWVDLLLFIVVVVLLIAFISRLVLRVYK
ncbi:MAG: hypothetical protein ABH821_01920 [archaeon]